ncbi:helix-turn-helix domain-containing protein [Halosquirtibacter xylanolyticus]|uniref:LamG-like jellyroll fold domain-containing protein n=1 Tax=Halosquirtibacter xylanolyticus TaxID=3374599 RepID=UPI0037497C7E|nr:helix-turn-helix domain-containing protein [Prolixibacteraceae bacterium]
MHKVVKEDSRNGYTTYFFNGENSYMSLPLLHSDDFTFITWIQPFDLVNKNMSIAGIPSRFWFRTTPMRTLQLTQPGLVDNNTAICDMDSYGWSQVAMVVSKHSTRVYFNGVVVDSFKVKSPKNKIIDSHRFIIGKDSWKDHFHGKMRGIELYDRALNDDEVKQQYRPMVSSFPYVDNLVAVFPYFHYQGGFYDGRKMEQSSLRKEKDSLRGDYILFDKSSSYAKIDPLKVDREITASMWISPQRDEKKYDALVSVGHAFAFRVNPRGALLFTIPQIRDFASKRNLIKNNEWQHVAFSFKEGVGGKIYYNGIVVKTFEWEAYKDVPKYLEIGSSAWNDSYIGAIDDLLIWNRLLTSNEIKKVYRQSASTLESTFYVGSTRPRYIFALIVLLMFLGIIKVRKVQKDSIATLDNEQCERYNEQLLMVVRENLKNTSFTVNDFARDVGVSRTRLYQMTHDCFQVSPKVFIRNLRLDRAALLLETTDEPIYNILFDVGFESRASFNKSFKGRFLATPSEYRMQKRSC